MSPIPVFLTGATGYIGGEILYQLLRSDAYSVTALVRTPEKAQIVEKQTNGRVKTVLGTLKDFDVLKAEAEKADVIISAANCDDVPSTEAIAEVLKKKTKKTVFIHTSGSSVVMDVSGKTQGLSAAVFSDWHSIDQINTFPDVQPHRPAEKVVFGIEEANPLVKTAIVSPSTVFGKGRGIDHVYSVQIPYLAKIAAKLKKVFTVDNGDYIWSQVHIEDLGELYHLILSKILAGEDIPTGKQGYYFGAYGSDLKPSTELSPVEHTWKLVADKISELLYAKGVVESKEAVAFTEDEISEASGETHAKLYWGTDSRVRGDNGVRIGWTPKYTSQEAFLDSFADDVDYVLANL